MTTTELFTEGGFYGSQSFCVKWNVVSRARCDRGDPGDRGFKGIQEGICLIGSGSDQVRCGQEGAGPAGSGRLCL